MIEPMIEAPPAPGPPRSFVAASLLLGVAGIALGGVLLSPQAFRPTVQVSLAIASVAGGFAMLTRSPWSRGQRALLLIMIGSLGVAVGMIGRFTF